MSRRPSRRAAVAGVVVAGVAAALVAASIAGADFSVHAGFRIGPAASSPRAASADPVSLTVTFSRKPGARSVAHVRCAGSRATADGFLRTVGARRACSHARKIAALLTRTGNPGRACTQIFGGPERALVTGRIGAKRIRHAFKRTDGCEIADWRQAMPLLPRPS